MDFLSGLLSKPQLDIASLTEHSFISLSQKSLEAYGEYVKKFSDDVLYNYVFLSTIERVNTLLVIR